MDSASNGRLRPLRRDAAENRERIVRAANEAFSSAGLETCMEEIARRAGVGVGTLYRRFPSKAALVDAIFEDHLDELVALARDALRADDPWTGLCGFLDRAIALQAAHRGFAEIVTVHLRDEKLVARARSRLRPLLVRLIERAQEAGALRDDVVYEDLSVLLWACGRVADSTRDVAPDYWRRHLALTLDGLRADGASALPRPPLTAGEHRQAMQRLADQLRLTSSPVRAAAQPRAAGDPA